MKIKDYKLYYYMSIIFVVCVMIANVIAGRLIKIGSIQLPASILVFPITFILGDLLTEFFGFKKTLLVTLIGFGANFLLVCVTSIAVILPFPDGWELSTAYFQIFAFTPRIFLASFSAFIVGSIANSILMILIKKATKGKYLWIRTISSTIVGEFLDSLIFCFIAFIGNLPMSVIFYMILLQASIKILYEMIFTPCIYLIKNKYDKRSLNEN